jgi:hypothetical protein
VAADAQKLAAQDATKGTEDRKRQQGIDRKGKKIQESDLDDEMR